VRESVLRLREGKQSKATLYFCDSRAFRLAQKLPCKGGRVRRKTVIGPRDELPKLSIAQSPGPIDPLCLLYGFTAELQEGTTTKIHHETKNRFTIHHHRIQARFFWESPLPEVPGAFGFSEGGDEVLSKMGNRGGITFLTPKFSIFETALRTRTSHPFIGGVPGRHF